MVYPNFPALIRSGPVLAFSLLSMSVQADWTDARCDIYPGGEDRASAVVPCVFSQRQGYINIDRSDGVSYDLSPRDDRPGNFKDQNGQDVYRKSGPGKDGLIFQFPAETVYVYWDTAGLPGTADADNSEPGVAECGKKEPDCKTGL